MEIHTNCEVVEKHRPRYNVITIRVLITIKTNENTQLLHEMGKGYA